LEIAHLNKEIISGIEQLLAGWGEEGEDLEAQNTAVRAFWNLGLELN